MQHAAIVSACLHELITVWLAGAHIHVHVCCVRANTQCRRQVAGILVGLGCGGSLDDDGEPGVSVFVIFALLLSDSRDGTMKIQDAFTEKNE
jgi:hypothetical protein